MMLPSLTYKGVPVWRHAQVLQWTAQLVSGILVVVLVSWLFANIVNAIQDRNIPFGFDFLSREYQTPIGWHLLPYESSDTFLYAFIVAVTNTLFVSLVGVVLATLLGTFIGIARLSGNWIISKAALVYVEFFRNVPLLVQLFFWFFIVLALPSERDGYVLAHRLYLNNAGLSFPWLAVGSLGSTLVWLGLVIAAIVASILVHRWLVLREVRTGSAPDPLLVGAAIVFVIGAAGWLIIAVSAGTAPFTLSLPEPQGAFGRISDGFTISGGLMALMVGLVMYTASFIAEIVRAGIQSVSRGQIEAARALGLSNARTLRQVTLPQAMKVIIPPLISQFLNLTKNSSLAGAIGFSDLTNVAKTMTQTAPAVSIFLLIMVAYLAMSLTYSLIGNLYNRRITTGRR